MISTTWGRAGAFLIPYGSPPSVAEHAGIIISESPVVKSIDVREKRRVVLARGLHACDGVNRFEGIFVEQNGRDAV
jgi:hypothetical protein